MRGTRAAILILAAAAAPAGAATVDYTSFHVLGDSLSDVGNLYRASFGLRPPSPPYWNGRSSNGPVWADRVARAFRAEDLPTGNHAWGGANARGADVDVPDLDMQASRYRMIDEERRGDRPLVAIFIGGNDILDAAGGPGVRGVGRRAASAVGDAAERLTRTGANDFLLFTLPDIGALPRFAGDRGDARSARRGARAFNAELDRQIAALRDDGARVRKVDTFGLFEDLLAHPRRYGVRDIDTPCLDEDGDPCGRRAQRTRAFFDEVHPNRGVHRRIAEAVLAEIAPPPAAAAAATPVPLPASGLLLAGAALALAGLARRQRYQRKSRGPKSAPSPATPSTASPYQAA